MDRDFQGKTTVPENSTTILQSPADLKSSSAFFDGKAPRFQDDFRKRLGFMAAVYFTVYLVGGLLDYALSEAGRQWQPAYWFDVVAMLMALAVFAATRMRVETEPLLNTGLTFEVLGAFFISMGDAALFTNAEVRINMISWVCLWIAIFPLFVPASFGKSLLASLLAASTGPLAYLLYTAAGRSPLPVNTVLTLYLPNYIAAAISLVPIYVINRYARGMKAVERMGSYELVTRLGAGGMGEVWKAKHGMLARPAAIKLIKRDTLTSLEPGQIEKLVARFQREAQSIAGLRSPHTIILYDFGSTQDNTLYYVMELLDGMDMHALAKKFGPVPPERAVHLLRQAARSLAEAHAQGLVHRDIKPANLFVCRLGLEPDFVKVLDFGLVRQLASHARDMTLTAEGAVTGTPAFLAPEAVMGGHDVDARADVYALGCVAYWLVTGQYVFPGDSPMQMAMNHLNATPLAPSERTELRIPPEFDKLVLDCLKKKPDERIQTVDELDERLAAIPLATPWTRERARQWWNTHFPSSGNTTA